MDARRRQADQHVADLDVGARQHLAALDRADGEAREIVVAAAVHARHLGGLAADQRAAGLVAALGDAGDDLARDGDVELAGRIVVEEEQRLGALHDQVVDAHRDEIDADRRVAAGLDGDLELGADAVVGGDQDRVLVAGRLEVEEAAEAAEVGAGPRPARRLHQRLDGLDQRIAGIDVDAGITVGDGCIGVGVGPVVANRRHGALARVGCGPERLRRFSHRGSASSRGSHLRPAQNPTFARMVMTQWGRSPSCRSR